MTFGVFNAVSEEIDRRFFQAFEEIKEMLEDSKPLSIKRTALLLELAYLDGRLSDESYCHGIDTTVITINKFINANNLSNFRTGGNFALFE